MFPILFTLTAAWAVLQTPLARVNGKPITAEDLAPFAEKDAQAALEKAILFELALQEAVKKRLDQSPAFQKEKQKLLYKHFLESRMQAVTEQDTIQEYEKAPLFHLYHIRVASQVIAKKVIAKLGSGTDFGTLVAQYSLDPDTHTSGLLEYRGNHNLPQPVYATLQKLPLGKPSPPIPGNGNDFHVVQPVRQLAWTDLPESLKGQWRWETEQRLKKERSEQVLVSLRKGAKIEYQGEIK